MLRLTIRACLCSPASFCSCSAARSAATCALSSSIVASKCATTSGVRDRVPPLSAAGSSTLPTTASSGFIAPPLAVPGRGTLALRPRARASFAGVLDAARQPQQTRPPTQATDLENVVLQDYRGSTVRLGDLWEERPAALIFLRH